MADPALTKECWGFGLLCLILFSPLVEGGPLPRPVDEEDIVGLPPLLPLPEFARSFNDGVSSDDGPNWERSIREDELIIGYRAATASSGTVAAAAGLQQGQCRRPLLEIISLIMDDIDGESPGNLFGRVEVTDVMGRQSMYTRDDSHYEDVYPGQPASLTGPSRPISAEGTVTVHLNLWDADFSAGNPNDHIIEKTFNIWGSGDSAAANNKEYGKRYRVPVRGDRGAATLDYMVFCDAVAAKIDATLIQGNDGVEDEVIGQIGARIADTEVEILAFNRLRGNYIQLRYNVPIPLSRTLVVVPSSSYLQLVAKLYDQDFSSEDDEIAAGCSYFPAKASGTTTARITGQSGEIEVKVTWI